MNKDKLICQEPTVHIACCQLATGLGIRSIGKVSLCPPQYKKSHFAQEQYSVSSVTSDRSDDINSSCIEVSFEERFVGIYIGVFDFMLLYLSVAFSPFSTGQESNFERMKVYFLCALVIGLVATHDDCPKPKPYMWRVVFFLRKR